LPEQDSVMPNDNRSGERAGEAPGAWTSGAARDRISSTLFLAALFHGIVILGVSFGTNPAFAPATSLDVVLLLDTAEQQPAPEDAYALAQQNLDGAGNVDDAALSTAAAGTSEALPPGPDSPGERRPQTPGERAQSLVLTTAPGSAARQPVDPGQGPSRPAAQRTAMPGIASMVEVVDEAATETRIRDPEPRELVISARTRESRIAAYLSNWKRKVERVGTLNFPRQARGRNSAAFPTLEVAIAADGRLQEAVILESSGERALDDAAMEILRIAAPFEPFPAFLREEYDVLRFAYQWRFGADAGVGRMTARAGS
jgi:protein TonB